MTEQAEFAQALRNRSSFYRMLAGLYFKPLTQEQIDTMAEADLSAFDFGDEGMARGFHDIEHYLRKRNTGTRSALAVDFTSAFYASHAYKGQNAVPYESVHASKQKLMMQEARNSVYGEYKRQALKLKSVTDTPEDHLSFELEFMALLSDRSAAAIEEGALDEALRNLLVQKAFLAEHIRSWFPAFEELALNIIQTRFYRGVFKVTDAFFRIDADFLADAVSEMAESAGCDPEQLDLAPSQEWIERYERESASGSLDAPSAFSSVKLW